MTSEPDDHSNSKQQTKTDILTANNNALLMIFMALGYKTFFMLISAENEIRSAYKNIYIPVI